MPSKAKPKVEKVHVVAPVESAEKVPVKVTDPCWNCGEQLTNEKCENCGFDKTQVFNVELEAAKAAQRQQGK